MVTSRAIDWVAVKSNTPLVTVGYVDTRGKFCYQEITCLPAVIGRCEFAEVQVHHPCASRIHCAIAFTGDALVVRDLESMHGTAVNGKLIQQCDLREGDDIAVGKLTSITILRVADDSDFRDADWL